MKNEGKNEIEGMIFLENFLTENEELKLIEEIYKNTWLKDLQRRVQHYGYKYDYKSKSISKENYLGKLPEFCNSVLQKIKELKISDNNFDQLIVNEYTPGQGISPHIDKPEFFEDGIISISLGSNCYMNFTNLNDKTKVKSVLLKRRSIICLTNEARYKWKHSIAQKKYDIISGKKVPRNTRISLTFRKVKGVI
jgi:alkylated DNA repair dioxygenase AlkB